MVFLYLFFIFFYIPPLLRRAVFLFVALNSASHHPQHPSRPVPAIRLARWFIHCQDGRVGIGRYTRALGIKPAISTVPFDFLIYARPQKPRRRFITAVEIHLLTTVRVHVPSDLSYPTTLPPKPHSAPFNIVSVRGPSYSNNENYPKRTDKSYMTLHATL